MSKILGLDLGTNSIGWAVINADTDDSGKIVEYRNIEDVGVRIFPEGLVKDSIGKGDKEQSKNATRREKRQLRRNYYRKRLRKVKLLEVLIEKEMCPLSKEDLKKWNSWSKIEKTDGRMFPQKPVFIDWLRLNPYKLRERALKHKITRYELGRIFYHLIQRRGFLSSRKSSDESTIFSKGKPEENILSINETREEIKDSTLGSYLNSILPREGNSYKTIVDKNGKEVRARGRYTERDMYIAEFEKIWHTQSSLLGLDTINVHVKKVRTLNGKIDRTRNKKKLTHLIEKYGSENVSYSKPDNNGRINIITYSNISLKEYLAGEIFLTEDESGEMSLRFKSNNSVLFWQRPLRSQKSLLSNCRFENKLPVIKSNGEFLTKRNGEIQLRSKKPCPLSHPEYELFRTYQFIKVKF